MQLQNEQIISTNSKNTFVKGAFILLIGALICKVLGAVYRIPLVNILGTEGMGLYQFVYPIYTLFLVVTSSAIPNTLSRIISSKRALGNYGYINKLIKITFIFTLSISGLASLLLTLFSRIIAQAQGNLGAYLGYRLVAPAIILVGAISVIRGIFQAREDMVPTTLSQIIEQFIKLVIGLTAAYALISTGIVNAVTGAYIAVLIGEVVSLIYLIFAVKLRKKNKYTTAQNVFEVVPSSKEIFCDLIKVFLPFTFTLVILPLSSVIDSLLLSNLLISAGATRAYATSVYGIYSGMVTTLLNLPVVFASSLATAIIPSITKSVKTADHNLVTCKIGIAFEIVLLVSLPCSILLLVYGQPFLNLLFGSIMAKYSSVCYSMLAIGVTNVVFLSFLEVSTAILQCFKKIWYPSIVLFFCLLLKILIAILCVNILHENALIFASVICFGLASILNLFAIARNYPIKISYILPCIINSIISVLVGIGFYLITMSLKFSLVISLIISGVTYLILTYFTLRNAKSQLLTLIKK